MTPSRGQIQAGFTLLEMLISLSVFLIVLATIAVALDSNRGAYLRGERQIDVQQGARLALGEMTTALRLAGYFPENFEAPPASPALTNAIHVATDDALAIHGDADGSGSSSVFLYCLDGSVLRRAKAPSGDSAAYWCPAGEMLAENVTALRFTYYDGDDNAVPGSTGSYELDGQGAGAVPEFDDVTERAAIRRVLVALTVAEDVPGQGPQVYTLGSEVRLRNVF